MIDGSVNKYLFTFHGVESHTKLEWNILKFSSFQGAADVGLSLNMYRKIARHLSVWGEPPPTFPRTRSRSHPIQLINDLTPQTSTLG
jgi:hypothetical protein